MLEGALIGLVVGVVAVIVRSIASSNAIAALAQAFAARRTGGIPAARAILDPKLKHGSAARPAGFALIDDRDGVHSALADLVDPVKEGHGRAVGLLALAMLGDPSRLGELAAVAATFDRDAPRGWRLPRAAMRDLAAIGRVASGAPSSELDAVTPDRAALQDPWVKLLLWDAMARLFERDGRAAEAANARKHTTVLNDARAHSEMTRAPM